MEPKEPQSANPAPSDRDGYIKLYELLRTEAHGYHDVMWKISFATVAAAAAVAAFLLGHIGDMRAVFGPSIPLLVLGSLIMIIGLVGTILAHVYALYFERTRHMGNVFRNAWLASKTREQTRRSLDSRILETRQRLKWNFVATVRWTAPPFIVLLVGAIVTLAAALGGISLRAA